MKLSTLLISVLFIGVMMMSISPFILQSTSYYNRSVSQEHNEVFFALNDSFNTFDSFSQSQVQTVEGKGIVTDAVSSEKVLEGGFSLLTSFFSLPSKIYSLITVVGTAIGIPAWAIAATLTFLIVAVISAIFSVAFRSEV